MAARDRGIALLFTASQTSKTRESDFGQDSKGQAGITFDIVATNLGTESS
jgi:hypothetical protein